MDVTIEPQPKGWVIVETQEIVVNIHPDCDGLAGELRDAALRVHELMSVMEAEEKDGKEKGEKDRGEEA